MKLFTYGDSWTEGVGGNLNEEKTTEIPEERTIIRHKYCWPKHLSELLNCEFQNDGVGGFCNHVIFDSICSRLKNKIINKDDFVIVMWSSSLRDNLPFFPKDNNFSLWGKRYKNKRFLYKYLFEKDGDSNFEYNRIEKDFRDFYVTDLFTDTYYDIVNQNYILYLQFMFKGMGIRYLFCDAFDGMISTNIIEAVNKTNHIDKNRYWGFKDKTFADFLINTKRSDVWEDGTYWTKNTVGKHPSNNGYKLIADELYSFILKNKLLEKTSAYNSYLI